MQLLFKIINLILIIENMRSAAGIGLAFKLAERARIEMNYCIPIRKSVGDKVNNGFQFGIGYEFV